MECQRISKLTGLEPNRFDYAHAVSTLADTMKTRPVLAVLLATLLSSPSAVGNPVEFPSKPDVIGVMKTVNTHWQKSHPEHGDAFWNRAVYHVGNLEAFQLTKDDEFLNYSEDWARSNDWKGAKSEKKEEWRYDYGENDRHVLFGDWQVCFQVYLELNKISPEKKKIERAKEVFSYQIQTEPEDYLWWSDGLFMVMPTMSELYRLTQDDAYLVKLRQYFDHARDLMFDESAGLFFRDAKYVYPKHRTSNGKKDFWARGNGWVFAALPKVIDDLPSDHPDREHYLTVFRTMAESLAGSQQEDGYWTRSMFDPAHAPGPEASGTAFFTYGLVWGLRHGVLDEKRYVPIVAKAWNFLDGTAVQEDGSLGYVQPIGEKAIPGQVVDASSTADFGVGAFLMAAAEMARYVDR